METIIELIAKFKIIQDYLDKSGHPLIANNLQLILLVLLLIIFPNAFKFVQFIYLKLKQRKLSNDLHPYYDVDTIKNAIKYFVPTKIQNIDPANELEPNQNYGIVAKQKSIPFYINDAFSPQSSNRYYLVLADSGMGKTTFMINLYSKYNRKLFKNFKIVLFPIEKGVEDAIAKIQDQRNTILLLDGLDEDPESLTNIHKRLSQLIDISSEFRKVLLTCRTQFFASEKDEPLETGKRKPGTTGNPEHIFKKMYISPFDDNDISFYLKKKYGRFIFQHKNKKDKARRIIEKSPSLMVRPMLLAYVDDLISNSKSKKKEDYAIHNIYSILIEMWIERESQRVKVIERDEYKRNLYLFTESLALNIAENRTINGLFLDNNAISKIAIEHNINLNEWILKGRSLLNRNSSGQIKFAHKSILEFFIAKDISNKLILSIHPDYSYEYNAQFTFEDLNLIEPFVHHFIFDKTDNLVHRLRYLFNINFIRLLICPNYQKKLIDIENLHEIVLMQNQNDLKRIKILTSNNDTYSQKWNTISNLKLALKCKENLLGTIKIKYNLDRLVFSDIPNYSWQHNQDPVVPVLNDDQLYDFTILDYRIGVARTHAHNEMTVFFMRNFSHSPYKLKFEQLLRLSFTKDI